MLGLEHGRDDPGEALPVRLPPDEVGDPRLLQLGGQRRVLQVHRPRLRRREPHLALDSAIFFPFTAFNKGHFLIAVCVSEALVGPPQPLGLVPPLLGRLVRLRIEPLDGAQV